MAINLLVEYVEIALGRISIKRDIIFMFDNTEIVTVVTEPREVTSLPAGTVVGDVWGGRSFTDNVAVALERRSSQGWKDVDRGDQRWTLIALER